MVKLTKTAKVKNRGLDANIIHSIDATTALRTMLSLPIDECKRRYRKDYRGRIYQIITRRGQDAKALHTVYTYGSRGIQDNRLYALLRELN